MRKTVVAGLIDEINSDEDWAVLVNEISKYWQLSGDELSSTNNKAILADELDD